MADATVRDLGTSAALTTGTLFPVQPAASGPIAKATFAQLVTLLGMSGVVGPTGATGAGGAAGSTGATGATGSVGAAGATGSAGAAGATGSAGAAGATGPAGSDGSNGSAGATGPSGAAGATGSAGAAGATGSAGAAGATGSAGAAGATGSAGATGATGPNVIAIGTTAVSGAATGGLLFATAPAGVVSDSANLTLDPTVFTLTSKCTSSATYGSAWHAPNQSPYLAGFFNDTYSSSSPCLTYFAYNNGIMELISPVELRICVPGYANQLIVFNSSGYVGINASTSNSLTTLVAQLDVRGLTTTNPVVSFRAAASQTAPLVALQAIDSTSVAQSGGLITATLPTATHASWVGQITVAANDYTAPSGGAVGLTVTTDGAGNPIVALAAGSQFKGILSATASLAFGTITTLAQAELTISVTGATVGSSVEIGPPAAIEAGILLMGYVSTASTVTVRAVNTTALSITMATNTFRATVTKF